LKFVPSKSWMPPEIHWRAARHPKSPLLSNITSSYDFVASAFYWVEWLNYYTMPHVMIFSGLPHLLQIAQETDYWAVSRSMSRINFLPRRKAVDFWRDAFPGMLSFVERVSDSKEQIFDRSNTIS